MATMDAKLWRPAPDLFAPRMENGIAAVGDLFLAALKSGQAIISGRTFVNCRLEGPAVFLALGGVELENCDLGEAKGDMRSLLLKPLSPTRVTGAIPFVDCRFEACSFFSVGFTGSDAFLDQLLALTPENRS